MFDRFTVNARKALNVAKSEAVRLQHERINTEDILAGVVLVEGSHANEVLRHSDLATEVVADGIRKAVNAERDGPRRGARARSLPFARESKRVLEMALGSASELGHNYIGTTHLLLGLLREERGLGGQVLRELGLDHERVEKVVASVESSRSSSSGSRRGCFLIAAAPIFLVWLALLFGLLVDVL